MSGLINPFGEWATLIMLIVIGVIFAFLVFGGGWLVWLAFKFMVRLAVSGGG